MAVHPEKSGARLMGAYNNFGRHSRVGGNPAKQHYAKRTKTCISLLRRSFLINWIPACAEMTAFGF